MIEQPPPDNESPTFGDIVEILRLPILSALVTAAVTWLIWYYTNAPCTPELASLKGCNLSQAARYINVDVFGRMLTYAVLVGGIGGLWKYDMIKKERAARIAAENQLAEFQKQATEERQQATEERQQATEERQALLAALAEERQQATEERQQALLALAEERQQAATEREAFMTTITGLAAQVTQLVEQRNGNHRGNGDSQNGQ